LQFYLEEEEEYNSGGGSEPFIVPYTDIRECIGHSQEQFTLDWQTSLESASDDYLTRVRALWDQMFDDLFRMSSVGRREGELHQSNHRGLKLDEAVALYVSTMEESRSRDLFTRMKKVYAAASMNFEALRKLVKKFDKGALARGDDMLTSTLLPELYSASLMAYSTLESHIETLRDSFMSMNDEEETELDEDCVMYSIRQKASLATKESFEVKRRAGELSWLRDMLAKISPNEIPRLVAHRGEMSVCIHLR
jgi:hypothetical protein